MASSSPIHITSPAHLTTLVSTTRYTLLDFHASWCGPCHMIAPLYANLSKTHARDGQLAFAKVDVDEQDQIAARFGITAMPTFVLLRDDGNVVDTVRGANPPAVSALVKKAVLELESEEQQQNQQIVSEKTANGGYAMTANPAWRTAI